jgi:hypothetical protein
MVTWKFISKNQNEMNKSRPPLKHVKTEFPVTLKRRDFHNRRTKYPLTEIFLPHSMRLSDLEPRFICGACGKRGADVRPDFNWSKRPVEIMGHR